MIVMLVAANPVGEFVNNHPTVKMLALSFLLLVGIALIADGFHFHIPRGYLYFAIFFSGLVEALNLMGRQRPQAPAQPGLTGEIVEDMGRAPGALIAARACARPRRGHAAQCDIKRRFCKLSQPCAVPLDTLPHHSCAADLP